MTAPLFSAGECPVCFDTGALLYLKRRGVSGYFYYCPLCGVAWPDAPPPPRRLDTVYSLRDVAPYGFLIPVTAEARACLHPLAEVPYSDWGQFLEKDLRDFEPT